MQSKTRPWARERRVCGTVQCCNFVHTVPCNTELQIILPLWSILSCSTVYSSTSRYQVADYRGPTYFSWRRRCRVIAGQCAARVVLFFSLCQKTCVFKPLPFPPPLTIGHSRLAQGECWKRRWADGFHRSFTFTISCPKFPVSDTCEVLEDNRHRFRFWSFLTLFLLWLCHHYFLYFF